MRLLRRVLWQRARRLVHKVIDSRDCTLSNKELNRGLDCNYGEDSDFVRVRVRGLATAADELQFIEREPIREAQMRKLYSLLAHPPPCGVDVSGGGAWSVRRSSLFSTQMLRSRGDLEEMSVKKNGNL